jgi:hypothetical protein
MNYEYLIVDTYLDEGITDNNETQEILRLDTSIVNIYSKPHITDNGIELLHINFIREDKDGSWDIESGFRLCCTKEQYDKNIIKIFDVLKRLNERNTETVQSE